MDKLTVDMKQDASVEVSGPTFDVKDALVGLGMKYNSLGKCFYYKPASVEQATDFLCRLFAEFPKIEKSPSVQAVCKNFNL